MSQRRADAGRHSRCSVDTALAGSVSTGRSTSVPHCCAPLTLPTPPPPLPPPPSPPPPADDAVAVPVAEDLPNGVSIPEGAAVVHDWEDHPHISPIVVVPRTAELQRAEDALGLALVVMVGGNRAAVSTAMVTSYLFERFGITTLDAEVRRHEPEDFVVRFRHQEDRDRVLAARPTRAPLPLVWRPWRRTSMASAGSFRFKVLIGLWRLPLHARTAAVAQAILGPSCTNIEVARLRDVPDNDDREFFVTAWCWHPRFTLEEQIIFIPEHVIPGACEDLRTERPGLRYLVCLRLVVFQDWTTPPPSPGGAGNEGDDDGGPSGGGGEGGSPAAPPESRLPDDDRSWRRDSDSDDSDDSNYNRRHPGFDRRRRAAQPPSSVLIGTVQCPVRTDLGGPGSGTRGGRAFGAVRGIPDVVSTPRILTHARRRLLLEEEHEGSPAFRRTPRSLCTPVSDESAVGVAVGTPVTGQLANGQSSPVHAAAAIVQSPSPMLLRSSKRRCS